MRKIKKLIIIVLISLLLISGSKVFAAQIPSKIFESVKRNVFIPVPGMKVEIYEGVYFKTLYFEGASDNKGLIFLENIPIGKTLLLKLTKPGYIPQYDIRSFSEIDIERGAIFWTSTEANLTSFYQSIGEIFDKTKGHIYLEINNEINGEGIEGINIISSSGIVFDLGGGDYLIANAVGSKVKIILEKAGYSFDIESLEIPVFAGGMTQYYLNVQLGGAFSIAALASAVTSAPICGFIKTLSKGDPISGVTVAFLNKKKQTIRPPVSTDANGYYCQDGFPVKKWVRVIPAKEGWKFKPKSKLVYIKETGNQVNFIAK